MAVEHMPSPRRLIAVADMFRGDGRLSDAARVYFKAGAGSLRDCDRAQALECFRLAVGIARDAADYGAAYRYSIGALEALFVRGVAASTEQKGYFYEAALEAGSAMGMGSALDMLRARAVVEAMELDPELKAALRRIDEKVIDGMAGRVGVDSSIPIEDMDHAASEKAGDRKAAQMQLLDALRYYQHGMYLANDAGDREYEMRVGRKLVAVLENLGDLTRDKRDIATSDYLYNKAVDYAIEIGDQALVDRITGKMKRG